MARFQLLDWLIENGGPVIRYRTATELADDLSQASVHKLKHDLLECDLIQTWLARLVPGRIHDSRDMDFENTMGKLLEFGFRAGFAAFDRRTLPFRRGFSAMLEGPPGMRRTLNAVIVASGLFRAGYEHEEALDEFLLERLDTLYRATRWAGYDIYVDSDRYPGIPEMWRLKKVPLVNPDLTPNGEFQLPYIHDIYALSRLPGYLRNEAVNRKIVAIVRYVLAPEYQALAPGYGLLRADKHKYYAVGWSVHLPRYPVPDLDNLAKRVFIQRIELMAHFSVSRENAWFRGAVQHLESFRTKTGTYLFPRCYLRELRDSYWVGGGHMGLEKDRKTSRALELESTFRMLKIKRLAGEYHQGPTTDFE